MEGEIAPRRFAGWREKTTKAALVAARVILGGIFLYAGLSKAFATQEFARDIQNYGLIGSADLVILLAIYLPWLEIAAGAALIISRCRAGALAIIAGLMLIFTGALTSAWVRGLDISCGCFAEERPITTRTHFPELLARDLALLLTAVLLLRVERHGAPADRHPPGKADANGSRKT